MGANDETLPHRESAPSEVLGPGKLFGRYLIVDRVGAGGVGEVYAAYDPALDRRIALKVLRSNPETSATADSRQHESLVREAKALASLSHPNVVTVHDVGREDDRTYIAMELVEGRDLEAWIRERPDRPWRETLAMFLDAGKGLAAAHAKGILHRDFKPANVLVGQDDWVRVSDFGLARLMSPEDTDAPVLDTLEIVPETMDTSVSVAGRMVGTPYFMAPEQIEGETTVRSDVYAYCLALHDALYGVRAFQARSLMELAVLKAKGPPKAPSDTRGVPAAVRAAIDKGLQAEPGARWESMAPLLDVLERALRPGSRAVWPWVLGLGAVGATLYATTPTPAAEACTGADAALGSVWDPARREAVRTGLEASGSPLADETAQRVTPILDDHASAWTQAHTEVCQATQRGEQSEALLDARMVCLQRQLLDFDAALDVFEAADATVVERAAQVVASLPDAERCTTTSGTTDESSPEIDAARAELAQINARLTAGLYRDADERAATLLASTEGLDAPRLHAAVLYTRGDAHLKMGRIEEAVSVLERSAFAAVEADDPLGELRAATLLIFVEGSRAARPEAGLRWSRFAQAALGPAEGGPHEASNIASHLSAVYSEMGDYNASEAEMRRALELAERAGTPPEERAGMLDNLGTVVRRLGRFDEAVALHDEAVALREAALGPDHPLLARSLTNAAAAYVELAKFDEADARYQRALEIRERTLGPEHIDVATTLMNMGSAQYRRGQVETALPLMERALKIRQAGLPSDHPKVLGCMSNVAQIRSELGEFDAASALFEEVLARLDARPELDPTTKSTTLTNLANLRVAQHRPDEAIALYEQALALDEATIGPDHPQVAMVLSNLGNVLEDLGRYDEALALQERSLKIRETKLGPDHPDLIWTLAGLSGVHQASGHPALAVPLLERALEIGTKAEIDPVLLAGVKFELAQAIDATGGDRARALALTQEALGPYREAKGREEDLAQIEAFLAELSPQGTAGKPKPAP